MCMEPHIGGCCWAKQPKHSYMRSYKNPYWTYKRQNTEMGQVLPFYWMPKSAKAFGFRGASPPDQGLCPWTLLGAPPPDPRYRLALPCSPCIWAVPLFITFRRLWLTVTVDRNVSCVNSTSVNGKRRLPAVDRSRLNETAESMFSLFITTSVNGNYPSVTGIAIHGRLPLTETVNRNR